MAVHTLDLLYFIVKCPFNKLKILGWIEKSFRLMYSNAHLNLVRQSLY